MTLLCLSWGFGHSAMRFAARDRHSPPANDLRAVGTVGTRRNRGGCSTEPEAIGEAVRAHAPSAVRVGLETGQMSNWLTLQLRKLGPPVVCLDARHAKGALSMEPTSYAMFGVGAVGLAALVRRRRTLA